MDEKQVYLVHFNRIGRTLRNQDVPFVAADAQDLAEQVFQYAQPHLISREFEVIVDLEKGKGSIEYGRFGDFTVEVSA